MDKFIEVRLNKWEDLLNIDPYFLSSFIFRGQSNFAWPLATSLERNLLSFDALFGLGGIEMHEKWMLHEFKRKFPLHSSIIPDPTDNFEWLAIMQHYGAPTRLLDFSESFFIAAYFSAIDSTSPSAVWAINRHNLRNQLRLSYDLSYNKDEALKDEVNLSHISLANRLIANMKSKGDAIPTVIPLEPKICTERLAKQQGLFLMQTSSTETFMVNLKYAFGIRPNEDPKKSSIKELSDYSKRAQFRSKVEIIKFEIPKAVHSDMVKNLKKMNITAEILFPGLEGLAKSLLQTIIRA
jgi:hypothetical protein